MAGEQKLSDPDYTKNVVIKNVPLKLREEVVNIAINSGQTVSGFLRRELRDISRRYPDDMKVKDLG